MKRIIIGVLATTAILVGQGQRINTDQIKPSTTNGDCLVTIAGHAVWNNVCNTPGSTTEFMTPKQFGAKGDGTTNDVTPFRNLIAALTPRGGTISLTEGDYYIKVTSGTEALLITSPISIRSAGGRARLIFDVPNGVDAIRIAPSLAGDTSMNTPNSGWYFMNIIWEGFDMLGATAPNTFGHVVRNYITIDTANNNFIWKSKFSNIRFIDTNGGYGIYMNTTLNPNGGMGLTKIENNTFHDGGIYLNQAGDTMEISNNEINGVGDGLFFRGIAGAVAARIDHNNIVTNGCPIIFDGGNDAVILNNEIGVSSFGTRTCTDATLYVKATGQTNRLKILYNNIGIDQNATPLPNIILAASTTLTNFMQDAFVDGNTLTQTTDQYAIINNASLTNITANNYSLNTTVSKPLVLNNGTLKSDDTVSMNYRGRPKENKLQYSKDLSKWTVSATGTASVPTLTSASIAGPTGATETVYLVHFALNGGTTSNDVSKISMTTAAGLPIPHPVTSNVWVRTDTGTCTFSVSNGAAGVAFTADTTWSSKAIRFTSINDTSDYDALSVFLYGALAAIEDDSCNLYITDGQIASTLADYVPTNGLPYPLTYGYPSSLISGPEWDTTLHTQVNPENYFVSSGNWNSGGWSLFHGGVASDPVVTTSVASPPVGVTSTVQQVVLDLNGGTTATDVSSAVFPVNGLANPHRGRMSIWMKSGTGTTYYVGLVNNPTGVVPPSIQKVAVTSAWQLYTFSNTVNGTQDLFGIELIGTPLAGYSNTATVLVAGSDLIYHNVDSPNIGAAFVETTTSAVDNSGLWVMTNGAQVPPVAVASLGTCTTHLAGAIKWANDSSVILSGSVVAAGGSHVVQVGCNGTNWIVTGGAGSTAVAYTTVVPSHLRYLGDGSDGAINCNGNISQVKYATTFTIDLGNTCTSNSTNLPLTVYATGACTIAGTLHARGGDGGNSVSGDSGGTGGGGGGGTGAGVAGSTDTVGGFITSNGGTAGTSSGGAGGTGQAVPAAYQRVAWSTPMGNYHGGSKGGAGGSSGGAGGNGGQSVVLICGSINFTGAIDVTGGVGTDSPGNNQGAGGGGGGGFVWLIGRDSVVNTGTITVAGGAGGSCGAFTGCGAGGTGGAGWSKVAQMQ